MAVRVKTKITSLETDSSAEVNALLNTGFESDEPEVLIPTRVAETLGLWPSLPKGAVIKAYETAGGAVRMASVKEAIELQVATDDKVSKSIKCSLIVSEVEREVLLSDKTIDELSIVIESAGKGIWRFRDEKTQRFTLEPQYW